MQSIVIRGIIPSKKNNKRILRNRITGKPFIASSESHSVFEYKCILQMKQGLTHCNKRQRIEFYFYPNTNRSFDIDNKITTLLDCLVRAGILTDDSIEYVYKISGTLLKKSGADFETLVELYDEF